MSLAAIVVALLILTVVGVAPRWPRSRGWGYAPSKTLGAVLSILIVLVLLGRL